MQKKERIQFVKAIFLETQIEDTSGVSLKDTNDSIHLDLNNVDYITKTDILEDDTGSVQVDSNKVENVENAGSLDDNESVHVKFNKAENIEKGEFYMKFKSKVRSRGRPKGSSRVRYGSKKKKGVMKISKNIESTNNETDNGDSKHYQKYKKARFEVMKNDGSCVNEKKWTKIQQYPQRWSIILLQ